LKFWIVIISILAPLLPQATNADRLAEPERAIGLILETSETLCASAPISGEQEELRLSGKAQAELKGLLKKLAGLGIEGATEYEKKSYNGVLQKDLAQLILVSSECKMDVWNDLQEKLVLPLEKSNSANNTESIKSNQEALIKDQNPTILTLHAISLKNYWESEEPYVVATLKNTSSVSAKNIEVTFWKETDSEIKSDDIIYSKYHIKNLIIRAGEEHDFPIAPISKYVNIINPSSDPSSLIDFRTGSSKNAKEDLRAKLCGDLNRLSYCNFKTVSRATFVVMKYNSIFRDQIEKATGFSNIFLAGEIQKRKL
jgi:hypothetical protein